MDLGSSGSIQARGCVDQLCDQVVPLDDRGRAELNVDGYGYHWFRVSPRRSSARLTRPARQRRRPGSRDVPDVVLDVVEVVAADRVDGERGAVAAAAGPLPAVADHPREERAEGRRQPSPARRRPSPDPAPRSGRRSRWRPGPSCRSEDRPRRACGPPGRRTRGGRHGRGRRTRAATRCSRRADRRRRAAGGSPARRRWCGRSVAASSSRSTSWVAKPQSGHTRSSTQVQSFSSGTIGMPRNVATPRRGRPGTQ